MLRSLALAALPRRLLSVAAVDPADNVVEEAAGAGAAPAQRQRPVPHSVLAERRGAVKRQLLLLRDLALLQSPL